MAGGSLGDLGKEVPVIGIDALGVAGEAAVGTGLDGGGETADFGLRGAQSDGEEARDLIAGNLRLRVIQQVVFDGVGEGFGLVDDGVRGGIEADGDDANAGFVGLDGVGEAVEEVERGLLVVFDDAEDAVLQGKSAFEHGGGIDRRDERGVAQAGGQRCGDRGAGGGRGGRATRFRR